MCFYSRLNKQTREIEERYKTKFENKASFQAQSLISGFAFPKTPVIANNKTELIQQFHWGLIPFWAKDDSIRQYTLNAKIETLTEKPSFKHSLKNRCLIIADGFFEWKWLDPKGKSKQKYLITLPNHELFAFGGIWSEWLNKETGEIINSYSIVTTEANELMSEIHNTKKRMPVILTPGNEQEWLSGKALENFKKINVELKAIEN